MHLVMTSTIYCIQAAREYNAEELENKIDRTKKTINDYRYLDKNNCNITQSIQS